MIDLGFSKKDTEVFNKYLRIPYVYFKFVRAMYPKNMAAAPYNLVNIITNYHRTVGRTMLKDAKTIKLIHGGIPPHYVDTAEQPSGAKQITDTLNAMVKNLDKLVGSGTVVYLHSLFETSALLAGVALCKQACATNVSWKMQSLPELFEMLKDFKGDHSDSLDTLGSVDILCLYMVGTEYATEYTTTHFKQLVNSRRIAKKVTVMCSHLTAEEFKERYGKDIPLCALEFSDGNELENYKALKRLVDRGNSE